MLGNPITSAKKCLWASEVMTTCIIAAMQGRDSFHLTDHDCTCHKAWTEVQEQHLKVKEETFQHVWDDCGNTATAHLLDHSQSNGTFLTMAPSTIGGTKLLAQE